MRMDFQVDSPECRKHENKTKGNKLLLEKTNSLIKLGHGMLRKKGSGKRWSWEEELGIYFCERLFFCAKGLHVMLRDEVYL